ncbi:MAG TPA: hypothetical protein VNI84_18940 [Pyrinomonadaceae bacterium]|nr:hypothetical protein [Pyrinomonadaceae bacterium]
MLQQDQIINNYYKSAGLTPVSESTAALLSLVKQGWRAAYTELFGRSFVEVLDSSETDDKHQSEAIEWHWNARINLIKFEKEQESLQNQVYTGVISQEIFVKLRNELQEIYYPRFWAYMAIWARGNMKTTIARYMTIIDAVLSVAYGVKSYALIVGGTVTKVRGTAKSISEMLQHEKIKEYAPNLAIVKKSDQGTAQGWTADFINTAAGCVFHFIGLDQGVAGANVSGVRPTFILPDDIDDREDSHVISEGRFQTLTRSVLGTKQWNTLFFFAQNLISRFAVLYRIYKQQVRVFANRFATEPIPAVRNFKTVERTENGIMRDIFVSGQITWRGWDAREVQNQIDTLTLPIFKIECLHEVEQSKEGLFHKKYDDNVHPISYSQFAAIFGSRDSWKDWYKITASDWARTKTKYHANVAAFVAVSSQNTRLPGHTFIVPFAFKADTSPEDVAVRLLEALTPLAHEQKTWKALVDEAWKRANSHEHYQTVSDRLDYMKGYYKALIPKYARPVLSRCNVRGGVNSHSEDKVRSMFNEGFGFSFVPSNPRETEALETIDEAMRVDMNEPHCFDPCKMGYSRFHVLCEDDKTVEPTVINGTKVYPPVPYPDEMSSDNLFDAPLFRFQMNNRRFADPELSKTGEKIDVALKLYDDFGQMLQMVYSSGMLSNISLSKTEKLEEMVSPTVRQEVLDAMPQSEDKDTLLQRRKFEVNEINKDLNKPVRSASINRFARR